MDLSINNEDKIKITLKKLVGKVSGQQRFKEIKEDVFRIPKEENYPYDFTEQNPEIFSSSVYEDYSSAYVTSNCRKSDPEILFEKYCESSQNVDWVYKNGDKGIDYLSVVYQNCINNKQSLFYPDYIVKLKDGTVWILETKGGQKGKQNQNIDIKVENKFEAFKIYAETHNLNWGFVRPMNMELYINNTEYTKDMHNSNWKKIKDLF